MKLSFVFLGETKNFGLVAEAMVKSTLQLQSLLSKTREMIAVVILAVVILVLRRKSGKSWIVAVKSMKIRASLSQRKRRL